MQAINIDSKVQDSVNKTVEVLNLKKHYFFKCYKCNHLQYAKPSIFMTGFQLNIGGGGCLKCKTYLALKIADDNKKMISFERRLEDELQPLPNRCFRLIAKKKLKMIQMKDVPIIEILQYQKEWFYHNKLKNMPFCYEALSYPSKVIYRKMEKLAKQGYLEYGVSLRTAWLTEKALNYIKKYES